MRSFADWTTDLAKQNREYLAEGAELPEGMYYMGKGEYKATCVVCGNMTEVYLDPSEFDKFDPTYHYCGGSPRCCP